MAKKKNFWYILVMTNEGPKFVTDYDYGSKIAHWDKLVAPKELGESIAKDISFGLLLNFYNAYPVCLPFELEHQPYMFEQGHFEWVEEPDKEVK